MTEPEGWNDALNPESSAIGKLLGYEGGPTSSWRSSVELGVATAHDAANASAELAKRICMLWYDT
jgi:hypothetical protein